MRVRRSYEKCKIHAHIELTTKRAKLESTWQPPQPRSYRHATLSLHTQQPYFFLITACRPPVSHCLCDMPLSAHPLPPHMANCTCRHKTNQVAYISKKHVNQQQCQLTVTLLPSIAVFSNCWCHNPFASYLRPPNPTQLQSAIFVMYTHSYCTYPYACTPATVCCFFFFVFFHSTCFLSSLINLHAISQLNSAQPSHQRPLVASLCVFACKCWQILCMCSCVCVCFALCARDCFSFC